MTTFHAAFGAARRVGERLAPMPDAIPTDNPRGGARARDTRTRFAPMNENAVHMELFEPPATPDFDDVVQQDWSCRRCGYNLRGLATAARCPECGLRVKLSLTWNLLRCSDPRWVRTLVRGLDLMLAGFAVFAVGFFAMICMHMAGLYRYGSGIWVVGVVIGFGAYLVGTFISTKPDPGGLGDGARTSRFLRRFVRGVAVILFVWLCLTLGPTGSRRLSSEFEAMTTGAVWVLAFCGFLAQLHSLQGLALRNERWDLAGRAFLLKWLVTFTYVPWLVLFPIALILNLDDLAPLFVCAGLGLVVVTLVYATVYLSLLARLRRDLKEEADLAMRETADVAGS